MRANCAKRVYFCFNTFSHTTLSMKNYLAVSILLSLFSLISVPSFAQLDVFGDIPEWVKPIDPNVESKVSKYDISSGFYTSLYDTQYNLETKEVYVHLASNITSNAGVSLASELSIAFDTSYHELKFHFLNIWRNGKKIDKTDEIEFEFLSSEQNLDVGIYSGQVTAYKILDDIRKDDKIEYAYTLVGRNPIFGDMEYEMVYLVDINPIDQVYVGIKYPKSQKLYYNCKDCDKKDLKTSTVGNYNLIEIKMDNVEALDYEETTPTWVFPFKFFELSTFKDWKEVNDWAVNIFKLDKPADLKACFEEIFNEDQSDDEKITAAIDFVQNDIRYMGIESGIGSIKPFHPNQVLDQRFGDCKDKTLLLMTILKELGIDSYPVLANTYYQDGIEKLLPAGQLFNHAIICIDYKGKKRFLDLTMSQQGGTIESRSVSDYGPVLVVKPGNEALEPMIMSEQIAKSEVEEELDVSSFIEDGKFTVTTTMHGLNADYMRSILEYYSKKELATEFKTAYGGIFPNIAIDGDIVINDNLNTNVMTIVEKYLISDFWQSHMEGKLEYYHLHYEPVSIYNYISSMTCDEKEHPVAVNYPSNFSQRTTIKLPMHITNKIDDSLSENAGFKFTQAHKNGKHNTIYVDYSFASKDKQIEAKDFNLMCNQIQEITNSIALNLFFPKGKKKKK